VIRNIYRFIFRYSARGQILVILMSLASLPFTYYALDVPKRIINSGIEGQDVPEAVFGIEVTQVQYLMALCVLFLVLVVINGAFKYAINVYKGVLGERLLRRLRYDLYTRVLRFPLPHFKRLSQGEVISMVTAETERLGDFIGDAVSEPAVQGGILLTYLFFIFNQDPFLGAAAIALYPVQMYVVPKLQTRVNELSKQRVRKLRQVSDRVGEGVAGIAEIHAHGTTRYERADISAKLGQIFDIRFNIYKRKYFIKFLNNFIASITPFFFYSVGGYFVIRGELSLGALVAVLAAYKDLNPPWKALLKYYQVKEDMRVRYEQIVEQFQPSGMLEPALIDAPSDEEEPLSGDIVCNRVTFTEDGVVKTLEGVSCTFAEGEHVALVGPGGSGKEELPRILARLVVPTSGQVRIGDRNLAEVPEAVLSRSIAYIGQGAFVFSGSVRHNLAYGLKREPRIEQAYQGESAEEWKRVQNEARMAGNSTDNIEADWIDYDAAHAGNEADIEKRMLEVLAAVNMRDDIYHLGLRNRIDPETRPEMARQFVEARTRLRQLIVEQDMTDLVEPFDEERYNDNATVAENLLFGLPLDERLDVEHLSGEPFVEQALKQRRDDGRAFRRSASRPRVFRAILVHQLRGASGLPCPARARRPKRGEGHQRRGSAAAAGRGPEAHTGAPPSRPHRRVPQEPPFGGAAKDRRGHARASEAEDRVFRLQPLQPGGHAAGQHPVRKAGPRRRPCPRARRRADRAGLAGTQSARGGHAGGARLPGGHLGRPAVPFAAPAPCDRALSAEESGHAYIERGHILARCAHRKQPSASRFRVHGRQAHRLGPGPGGARRAFRQGDRDGWRPDRGGGPF